MPSASIFDGSNAISSFTALVVHVAPIVAVDIEPDLRVSVNLNMQPSNFASEIVTEVTRVLYEAYFPMASTSHFCASASVAVCERGLILDRSCDAAHGASMTVANPTKNAVLIKLNIPLFIFLQKHNRRRTDRSTFTHGVNAFARFCFDADTAVVRFQNLC